MNFQRIRGWVLVSPLRFHTSASPASKSRYGWNIVQYYIWNMRLNKTYKNLVTLTDNPKLVRNRWVIELFGGVFVLSLWPFDISVGIRAFVMGLSQISSFFSHISISVENLFQTYKLNQRSSPSSVYMQSVALCFSCATSVPRNTGSIPYIYQQDLKWDL